MFGFYISVINEYKNVGLARHLLENGIRGKCHVFFERLLLRWDFISFLAISKCIVWK